MTALLCLGITRTNFPAPPASVCRWRESEQPKMESSSPVTQTEGRRGGETGRARALVAAWRTRSHSCVSCSPRAMMSIRGDKPGVGLSPPALPSDGGPLKSAGIPRGCSIIHLRSVTQPTALFHVTWALLRGVRSISASLRHPGSRQV